jgi:DNA modification methylase
MTVRILHGDCRDTLKTLPDASVHACVTSPPYWGLRDYGTAPLSWPAFSYAPLPGLPACVDVPAMDACLGLEPTLEAFIGHMVLVFRQVHRVLRDDATCWVNMGDCYATGAGKVNTAPGGGTQGERWKGIRGDDKLPNMGPVTQPNRMPQNGLKAKDLAGQPWRLAFALQADGWWLRQDCIWSKKNPMPESTRDRCTKAHEYVFLLAKSERYYWNFEAMQEESSDSTHARMPGNKAHKHTTAYLNGAEEHRTKAGLVAYAERQRAKFKTPDGWDTSKGDGGHGSFHKAGREKGAIRDVGVGHNARPRKAAPNGSGTKNNPSFDAAMAVMPESRNKRSVWHLASEPFPEAHFATFPTALIEPCILAGCPEGGTVLDPFGGAGTTGLVADRLQRSAILCELNPDYIGIAERRITGDAPLFAEVAA